MKSLFSPNAGVRTEDRGTRPLADGDTPPPSLGFWFYAAHLLTIWGLALSNLCMAAAGLWSLKNRRNLPWDLHRDRALFVPAGLYMIFFGVSILTSLELEASLGEIKDLLSWITLGLAPTLIRGEKAVRRVVDAILVMILLLALHGIGQYYLTDFGTLHRRIIGLFSHYQTFAGVLLVGTMVLAARLATHGRRQPHLWIAFAVLLFVLQLSLTRGAWVAAILTLALPIVLRAKRRFLVAGLVLIPLFVWLAPDHWTERWESIVDLQDVSNYDRLCMAEAAGYMIAERPLFGIGPEVVETRYAIYRHPTAPRTSVPHLHNNFLQRAAEQGLMGLTAYLALMIAALGLAVRGLRREGGLEGPRADLYLATVLVVVGFNIAGLFEDNWRDTEIRRLVLFLIALPLCLKTSTPEPSTPEPSTPEPSTPEPSTPEDTHDS